MKLSKKSKLLMSFLSNNNYVIQTQQTKKTVQILSDLHDEILKSYKYITSLKQTHGEKFYNINIKHIQSALQITKPKNFNNNSFPFEVRNHIDTTAFSELSYSFSLFDKNIRLIFIVEEANIEQKIETYNRYVDAIIMWIYILNEYASKFCAKIFTVYFYFTSLEKKLPSSDLFTLDEINANTAFTTTCPRDSEIVIYRKEEWFKVFMHETFHNFGLDFSDMNTTACTIDILKIFPVNSDVNLYEAYAEYWAEIMNALFCSFLNLKNKKNVDEFLTNADLFINYERSHSFLQLVKALHFMKLTYKDLYAKTSNGQVLRDTLYKEKTNILSYYVIKTILMNNYQGFLNWCTHNNNTLLQFRKTPTNIKDFCNFIEKNYKTKSMIENIERTEKMFYEIKGKKNKNEFLTTNLRMSVCEMG